MLGLLPPQRLVQRRLLQDARLDQELAEALSPRRPGVDDATLMEPDARLCLTASERERPGAAAEMDELQRVGDGDVLDVAREAHGAYCRRTSATRLSSVFSLRSVFE